MHTFRRASTRCGTTELSLHDCKHGGQKLPDALTCGKVCSRFPACLPRPSPQLLALLSQFSAELERERNSAAAVACGLSDVREAITEELDQDPE
jgi:hypothetical protein